MGRLHFIVPSNIALCPCGGRAVIYPQPTSNGKMGLASTFKFLCGHKGTEEQVEKIQEYYRRRINFAKEHQRRCFEQINPEEGGDSG